ncbi:hypothetical protein Pmani_028472 [Petrolisthes manimaculis]|uniref:Uncharacterized protein n=1 Tax=Petrolisthes manimaculis TaxID=1843537 RepID=A0AAE1NZG3_9EUCA|nr:hypothetical protein Pmani_028472 [Petrolisthes manimaculis]
MRCREAALEGCRCHLHLHQPLLPPTYISNYVFTCTWYYTTYTKTIASSHSPFPSTPSPSPSTHSSFSSAIALPL